ncbi:MAG: AMP-binding protein [Castellaniella sp.]
MTPIDFFERAARAWPGRPALLGPQGDMSYAELAQAVDALACHLQACDPEPGSRVALCAGNRVEYVVAMLAIMAAGKVWVPLNARSTARELARILDTVSASIVMVDAKGAELVGECNATVLSLDTLAPVFERHAGRKPRVHERGRDATQAIKFTGGTTGLPKGVMQPMRAWVATIINQIAGWQITAQDRFVAAAPLSHGTGTYVLPTLAQGGAIILVDGRNPDALLRAFSEQGGSMTFMPPTLIYKLMELPGATPAAFPDLRLLIYGGAPMPESKIVAAQGFFGPVLATTFGQTEAPQIVTWLTPDLLADTGLRNSVGRATWFSEVAIVAPDGSRLGPGEKGEVLVRGDLVMTGYWQQPELSARTVRDGWLHTGDVGMLDERGFLFLKERLRDVIISGGFNVYPVDVEGVLSEHAAVHEAAVFGLPDDKWGETVNAVIELRPGNQVEADALKAFVRERVGPVLTPKNIWFCESLPRSPVGKVLKADLRRDYETH